MFQTTKKRASGPKCPVTGKRIQGVCHGIHRSIYFLLVSFAIAIFCQLAFRFISCAAYLSRLLARLLSLNGHVFFFSFFLPVFLPAGDLGFGLLCF